MITTAPGIFPFTSHTCHLCSRISDIHYPYVNFQRRDSEDVRRGQTSQTCHRCYSTSSQSKGNVCEHARLPVKNVTKASHGCFRKCTNSSQSEFETMFENTVGSSHLHLRCVQGHFSKGSQMEFGPSQHGHIQFSIHSQRQPAMNHL